MENYIYQNNLIGKKQLKQILRWSFINYDSMQACTLADELKYLGFRYATQSGISISIEDLQVPFIKSLLIERANQDILNSEKVYLKGKITDFERSQKLIDTWSLTSDSLKDQVINYFKNYDPLNSVYIMAFSGARGNLSQVRQLVGMRGLMSDPSGEVMSLPIKKNFREGLTVTDYLMSGYGARKGIIDTALKTANSGYLTRRLIDVAQDILIRDKDCQTSHAFLINKTETNFEKLIGRILNKPIFDPSTLTVIATRNTQITPTLINNLNQKEINELYIRSPLTCKLYRAICQQCYGWDLATENLIDMGEAIGILAGQSIGEPGTQLTMRTFHTGGVFTSEKKEKIISPSNGIIQFSKFLKTVSLRTNRGDSVVISKNSGSLLLVPQIKTEPILKIQVSRNTILFPSHNQYIQKSSVIAEIINANKQVKNEVSPILAINDGEIIVPKLKKLKNYLSTSKLLWLLYGNVYNSPINSYINFYPDHKLNKNSFVFRTKIVNTFHGKIIDLINKQSLYRSNILIENYISSLKNFNLFQLSTKVGNANGLLCFKNFFYLLYSSNKNNKLYLKITRKTQIAHFITNAYKTKTGGQIYYDSRILFQNTNLKLKMLLGMSRKKLSSPNLKFYRKKLKKLFNIKTKSKKDALINLVGIINFFIFQKEWLNCYIFWKHSRINYWIDLNWEWIKKDGKFYNIFESKCWDFLEEVFKYYKIYLDTLNIYWDVLYKVIEMIWRRENIGSRPIYRTLIWLEEETHILNCERNVLLVRHGDFITKDFEIIPGCFSKTEGLVRVKRKNNIVKTVKIQSGLIYEGNDFEDQSRRVYFQGEKLFSNVNISSPSICKRIKFRNEIQLLIRPIQLYEFPKTISNSNIFINKNSNNKIFKFAVKSNLIYNSSQKIQFDKSLNLILNAVFMKIPNNFKQKLSIRLQINKENNDIVNFFTLNKIDYNKYIFPTLKYKNLNCCTLLQKNQFIDKYTNLAYLESSVSNSLEIVKIKINLSNIKQILLISNDNCTIIEKEKIPEAKLDEFILNAPNVKHIGKVIFENEKFFIIQKGRPYFFPNCQVDILNESLDLSYKFLPFKYTRNTKTIKKNVFLNCFNNRKILLNFSNKRESLFARNARKIKNENKLNSLHVLNTQSPFKIKFSKMLLRRNGRLYSCLIPRFLKQFSINLMKENNTLPYLNSFNYKGKYHKLYTTLLIQDSGIISNASNLSRLTLIKFLEYPFAKSNKSIGLHSITEDFFEEDLNSVFCQSNQFLENGTTIGLLNIEKEITGDIVQGLPRIEEILEARKKNQIIKRIPASKKKGLLTNSTSLDQNFEFWKLGSPIQENEKINPHKLLKVYFHYYGFLKPFFCDRQNKVKHARLTQNFEGSYKSFKKVQCFILNSVQAVYKSQGVNINDKHLEIIIKQMTTKVLITGEGDTPLLKREVIDLYHIKYINNIMKKEKKQIAYYLPLLFGITRSALNNPSFISAASFQETTRVLTKAAIEGRIDWLKGLKENIIIGHLIPAGTGSRNYKNSFKKFIE